uniref:DZF domain-containing protein n=1 Tax=Ditylenchus dipsaci TaxID=166011 RepID=A0A915DXX9_9BILA
MDEIPEEVIAKLRKFTDNLTNFEDELDKFLSVSIAEQSQLPPLEKARNDLTSLFALNSLYWTYLSCEGKNPKEDSELAAELKRAKEYMNKLKQYDDNALRPKVNQRASKAFVRNALFDFGAESDQQQGEENDDWDHEESSALPGTEEPVKKKSKKTTLKRIPENIRQHFCCPLLYFPGPHFGSEPVKYVAPAKPQPEVKPEAKASPAVAAAPKPTPLKSAKVSAPAQRKIDYTHLAASYSFRPAPFDQYICEDVFPRNDSDEATLTQLLLNRHQAITPGANEQAAIQSLVTKIHQILDRIVVNPDSFMAVAIEEVREVGSFKKGTMVTKSNVADLVIILKSLPTIESVNALGQKIVQDLKTDPKEVYGAVTREYGCEIAGTQAVVRLLVTILPQNAGLLDPDLHLSERVLQSNMATIRHARWFEEHATHSSVKLLIRILKDIKKRFDGFKNLNIWCIELLSHYCVMHTRNRSPLPLASAFKRFFQILATGMLLPTSPSLVDPDMDNICSTAQTLLRVILHGGAEQVLGMDAKSVVNVASELTVWNNVVVTPLEKAYSAADMEPYYGEQAMDTTNSSGAVEVKTGA